MNPSNEKEKPDSSPMEDKPEEAPADQEAEEPPAQSGGETSSSSSSSSKASQTSQLDQLNKIARSLGKEKMPEILKTLSQISEPKQHGKGFSKGKLPKSRFYRMRQEEISKDSKQGDDEDIKQKRNRTSDDEKKERGKEDPFSNPSVQYVFGTGFRGGLVASSNQQRVDFQQISNLPMKKRFRTPVEGSSVTQAQTSEDSNQGETIEGSSVGQAQTSEDVKQGETIEGCSTGQARKSEDPKQDPPGPDPNDFDSDPFFFEVMVTNSNCLRIPFETTLDFIPVEHTQSNVQRTLWITDHLKTKRAITYVWFEEQDAFILTENWSEYAEQFKLRLMDKVRFTEPPKPPLQKPKPLIARTKPPLHFLIQIFRRPKNLPIQISLPKFLPENILTQVELTLADVQYGRLAISGEKVRSEFTEIKDIDEKYQMVKCTDRNDKDWFLKVTYVRDNDRYMVMDGWERLIKEYQLAAGNFVRFYEPETIEREKHFLIQFMKRKRKYGDLESDAEKEDNQPISSSKRKKTKRDIAASVQAWKKGEDVPASVGEDVTKVEKNISTSSTSVLSGLSSEDLSNAQMQYELDGRDAGSLENFVRMQQKAYSNHQVATVTPLAVQYPSDSDNEEEEMDPMPVKELVFELNLTDPDHLVIPYMPASRYFPKLLERKPMTDEILHLTDRNDRHWFMDLTYDVKTHSYVITKGLSLYLDHYYLNPPDMIQVYVPADGQRNQDNHFNIKHKKLLGRSLFVVNVLRSNKLTIPCNLEVVTFFSPPRALPPPEHLREFPLQLIDHRDTIWEMRFICFEDEEAYVVYRGWEDYVARYGLNYKDSVRFFEWKDEKNSFVIFHEPGPGPEARDDSSPPMFVEKNYVCGLELTAADVELNRLEMLGVQIAFLCRGREMVKLTDANNKNWYVIIVQIPNYGGYVIEDGWDEVVREHELREGDEVKLYSPEGADHDKHFLIQLNKKPRVEKVTKSAGKGSASWKGKEKM